MLNRRAVIFANGEMSSRDWAKKCIMAEDTLIAADGGLNHCLAMQLTPVLLIGDLDSVTAQQVAEMTALGCQIEKYPVEKNETDLELALLWAAKEGFERVILLGALGGRLDQTLANLSLLLLPELNKIDVRILTEDDEIFQITSESAIEGIVGDRVSLLPWGGAVVGVTTMALKYPLAFETLMPEHARGVSNVMLAESAWVSVESGSLLCIHSHVR